MIDFQRAQDDQQVNGLCSSPSISYHNTYPTTVTGSNIFHLISHNIMNCLGAWLFLPVKKCGSDKKVTPLIREVSDWRLRRQHTTPKKHYYIINWYVASDDLTQWIDNLIRLDSIFTLDVNLGIRFLAYWICYLKWDFRRKELSKNALSNSRKFISFRPIIDKQIKNWIQR